MTGTNDGDVKVVDNKAESRFEARIGEAVAVNPYRLEGDTMTFTGTVVPDALRGQGIGEKLVRAGLDAARERGLKVVPQCGFVAAFIRRNDEYADLVAAGS